MTISEENQNGSGSVEVSVPCDCHKRSPFGEKHCTSGVLGLAEVAQWGSGALCWVVPTLQRQWEHLYSPVLAPTHISRRPDVWATGDSVIFINEFNNLTFLFDLPGFLSSVHIVTGPSACLSTASLNCGSHVLQQLSLLI
jgi:hypothetical protein